jgi:hypothetical protein
MVTKWELITDTERMALVRTPFGKPCSGCGRQLDTEADFAQHFALIRNGVPMLPGTPPSRDYYYLNLGVCPDAEA